MTPDRGEAPAPDVTMLATHAFLRGMPPEAVALLARSCRASTVPAGRRFFEEGEAATRFWLLRGGHVALEVHSPGDRRLIVETLGRGDLLGLSWLLPPYQWQFGALAIADTAAFEFDGEAVLAGCDADPSLGYHLLRRFLSAASGRLQSARIRMLDLYATPTEAGAGP